MDFLKAEKVKQGSHGFKLVLPFDDPRQSPGADPIGSGEWETRIVRPDGTTLTKESTFPDSSAPSVALEIAQNDLNRVGNYIYQVVRTSGGKIATFPQSFKVTAGLLPEPPPPPILLGPTPISLSIPRGATRSFYQGGGVESPVWTLEGDGVLTQDGQYTAPMTPGTALIRLHSPAWEPIANPDHWVLQEDDRVMAVDPEGLYWHGISSNGRLNEEGDYLVWETPASSIEMYWTGVWQASGAYGGVYLGNGSLRSYDGLGSEDFANPTWLAGDKFRYVVNSSLGLDVYQNDVLLGSSTRDHSAPYYFLTTLPIPDGALVVPPRFFGAGISGYTEYYAEVTIT